MFGLFEEDPPESKSQTKINNPYSRHLEKPKPWTSRIQRPSLSRILQLSEEKSPAKPWRQPVENIPVKPWRRVPQPEEKSPSLSRRQQQSEEKSPAKRQGARNEPQMEEKSPSSRRPWSRLIQRQTEEKSPSLSRVQQSEEKSSSWW